MAASYRKGDENVNLVMVSKNSVVIENYYVSSWNSFRDFTEGDLKEIKGVGRLGPGRVLLMRGVSGNCRRNG